MITMESTEFEMTEQMTKFLVYRYVRAIEGFGRSDDVAKTSEDAMVFAKMVEVFVNKATDAGICSQETKDHSIYKAYDALYKKWGVS